MDSLALAVLVEAASAGSLAGAARRLGIGPMAAGRSLAGLERELGVRLMQRTTRSLSLTAEGQAFLPHAQALLDEEAAAIASVRRDAEGATGLLRVTTSSAFGRKVVAPFAAAFMADNPRVRIDLLMTDRVVDIVGEGVDVAIRIAHLRDSELVARRLADSPRGFYAAPDYVARKGAPAASRDLERHECLAFSGQTHWPLIASDGAASVRVDGRFTCNSVEGLHQACLDGLGIALLSEWVVREDLAAGRLVPLDLRDATADPLAIWAVYPTRRMLPSKVSLFVDALHRKLAG